MNALDLSAPQRIRQGVPIARRAALAEKNRSESNSWRTGDFTGLPIAIFQNWLYEQKRLWRFKDGTLAVLWCVELPNARSDYAEKHHYIGSTRREYREAAQRELARKEELSRLERERADLVSRQSALLLMMFEDLARTNDTQ